MATLRYFVGMRSEGILEVCAGVRRVVAALAILCRERIGGDVSENMVSHIRKSLAPLGIVKAIAANGFDLSSIRRTLIDVICCTIVSIHLNERKRFGHVYEGFRALKPGGRMLVDDINLLSDELFEAHRAIPGVADELVLISAELPRPIRSEFAPPAGGATICLNT